MWSFRSNVFSERGCLGSKLGDDRRFPVTAPKAMLNGSGTEPKILDKLLEVFYLQHSRLVLPDGFQHKELTQVNKLPKV